ncbi:ABC-type transport system involved in multi-copper enzyme maturation, permease component [Streptococcus porcinus]|uniref:ABC transporter permease n=1 Tax=Streptococcus porcinus TaxID=1340 RepID=UPI0010CABB6F|nr:ABC transporter permease subunit [Streptococcus porcinus]VTS16494.1 ABC-type transport system involved in multi-copper enzyme maturation, permease component [Streptococcus porcinus]
MTGFTLMLKKEWLESSRSHKALALLIISIIFGILGPLTALLMPEIMAGILPKKLQEAIPDPTYLDSYVQYFKQVNQLGLILLVFLFSGTLTQEFTRGTLINLITKGLSKKAIILAKFTMIAGLWTLTYSLGSLTQYTYTLYYFNNQGKDKLLVYGASWLVGLMLISLILLYSVLFRKTAGLLIACLMTIVTFFISGFFKITKDWNPMLLIQKQSQALSGHYEIQDWFQPALLIIAIILISLTLAILIFERSET